MHDLQIFTNPQFGQVRTIQDGDKVLFCGSDVAKALGYKEPHKAVARHCKGGGMKHPVIDTLGRTQDAYFIPEGDIYRLAAKSELPGAEQFESWIFDDVLPSIRKHGMYAVDELLNNPDFAIKAFAALKEEREKRKALEAKREEDQPKVLFADAVATARTTILISELAKLLKQNGIDIGQNRLFEWLRTNGYIIRRSGADYNMPTQRSMEMGLFEIKETAITHSDGHTTVNRTTKVTGKGQLYFINKFLGERAG